MSANAKSVVISQPMYFPWIGIFEQIRLSDVFVHYDDVQFTRGFYNRVQVKTPQGTTMLSVPLSNRHRGQRIDRSEISYQAEWIAHHRKAFSGSCRNAPYLDEALSLFDQVTTKRHKYLSALGIDSIMSLARYLGLAKDREFYCSSELGIGGSSSHRLLDICRELGGDIYVTGHGALNYLDHQLFQNSGVEVEYLKYQFSPYRQAFGDFTPYLTALDAIAHRGSDAISIFKSSTRNWRIATDRPDELKFEDEFRENCRQV